MIESDKYLNDWSHGYINFTQEELKANRRGILTSSQLKRLSDLKDTRIKLQKSMAPFVFLALILIFVIPFFISELAREDFLDLFKSEEAWLGIIVVLIFLIGGASYPYFTKKKNDPGALSITKKSGKAKKYIMGLKPVYVITIRFKRFFIFKEMYDKIEVGQSYNIYYVASKGDLILSWEKL